MAAEIDAVGILINPATMKHSILFFAVLLWASLSLLVSCKSGSENKISSWSVYRGDKGSSGYSRLDQINKKNVDKLKVAWTYNTGDSEKGMTIQCNPVLANGMLFITSAKLKLISLDPKTGKQIWRFDPLKGESASGTNRGVTYWENGNDKRVFMAAGSYLYALEANTGNVIESFGDSGRVDLRKGLGRDPEKLAVTATTPGVIYKGIIIQGTAVGESYGAAPGFIRAYDVLSGKTVWTFHTIPQPGEFGNDTWPKDGFKEAGGVNSWGGMSLDEARGIVYIPTGSPAFDFYGGNRKGNNLFGNCLLALEAATGKLKWHFQLVHHDLWDYDLPAPPNLLTVVHDGKKIDAVAQITKMGMVFLFDRETGKPLFPIEERAVPKSDLVGEEASPTQPFPVKPPPFARQLFNEDEITNISPVSNRAIRELIKNARTGSIFIPPSVDGVVQIPGTRGGGEWGGASVDPETGILYVNANEIPMFVQMKIMDEAAREDLMADYGQRIYRINNCASCHGADRKGSASFPSLINLSKRQSEKQVASLLATGKGQMPAFPNITDEEKEGLIDFLLDSRQARKKTATAANKDKSVDKQVRYIHNGWTPLMDAEKYPGMKPPWGTLNAIDLNKGEIVWKVPLGEYAELLKKGLPPTGTQNLGGSAVTAGGLVFIGATKDEKFRAFDKDTGVILWEYTLPAGGYATPATYEVDGKQYIVIAAGGGGKVGSKSGDAYVAFALGDRD